MTATELNDVALVLDALSGVTEGCREKAALVALADPGAQVEVGRDLVRRGYRVFTAASGMEALWEGLARAYDLDVLVCDADLPNLPAVDLYRRLKVTIPHLLCCVVTASLSWPDEPAAVRLGAGVVHTAAAVAG